MKIAIIGTRGIPNQYGGFEQFAEYLSVGLIKAGDSVTVYNSHNHPYRQSEWNGVSIVHKRNPEKKIGKIGQFVYDLECIRDTRKQEFDIILQLGYTSSSIWGWLLPFKKSIIVTNMDGLEWKRSRYSNPVKKFLKFAEKLAIKFSNYLIADSIGIQEYLKKQYNAKSEYIPYGANLFTNPDCSILANYNLKEYEYNMLIARLEPENSIETILEGVAASKIKDDFLVIGNNMTPYGEYLKSRFASYQNIRFIGGIYNINELNNLRHYSNLYFHGHTVGGTNPSLLEAMASQAMICAHNNVFNASILGNDAFFFNNVDDVCHHIKKIKKKDYYMKIEANEIKIKEIYLWEKIIKQYRDYFSSLLLMDKVKAKN